MAATRGGKAAQPPPAAGLSARATLAPRVALLGTVVTAGLRITVDRRRVDPRTLRVRPDFAPYTVVSAARHRDGADTVALTYRLQCLDRACSRPAGQAPIALRPARVSWPGGRVTVGWPQATVASHLTAVDLARPALRFDATPVPDRYRIDPVLLGRLAVGGSALLLVAAAGVLAARVGRRRSEPERPLSPVELALERLARVRHRGERARRAAVGNLADALEQCGFPELAPLARRLAWSAGGVTPAVASELHLLVRAAVETAA